VTAAPTDLQVTQRTPESPEHVVSWLHDDVDLGGFHVELRVADDVAFQTLGVMPVADVPLESGRYTLTVVAPQGSEVRVSAIDSTDNSRSA
jgi:hypothetical protein